MQSMISATAISLDVDISDVQANSYTTWFRLVRLGNTSIEAKNKVFSLLKDSPNLLLIQAGSDRKTILHSMVSMEEGESYKQLVSQVPIMSKLWISLLFLKDSTTKSPLHTACKSRNVTASLGLLAKMAELGCTVADFDTVDASKRSPLHYACANNMHDVIKELIRQGSSVRSVDRFGHTPLYYVLVNKNWDLVEHFLSVGADLGPADANCFAILETIKKNRARLLFWSKIIASRPVSSETSEEPSVLMYLLLSVDEHSLWLWLMNADEESDLIKFAVLYFPNLASVKDSGGRKAIELATSANREAINSVLLWHGRYRRTEERPEHESATCFVFKAVDEMDLDSEGRPRRVALKLMRIRAQFNREIESREVIFSEDAVISIILTFPAPDSPESVSVTVESGKVLTKQQAESMYCIVFPLADRNLFVALKQERFAGRKWTEIAHIFKQLATAVQHMHTKGVVHGDLKPLNIVRVLSDYLLIDLDASCIIGRDALGSKSSSAFIPPEAVYVDSVKGIAAVKSEHHRAENGLDYELLIADTSFDVWSLGCILYQMCTDARSLFVAGQDDNLKDDPNSQDSLFVLFDWTNDTKDIKLREVASAEAQNLISQLLSRDPKKRPPLSRVLLHPFLTGKRVIRMVGTKAEYDVFLSYRVAIDKHNAQFLYDELTKRKLKVWWDAKCLKDGENWEEGFCQGLVNSKVFVCILSKQALANFATLTPTSRCDSMLLEHQLAEELLGMGLLSNIFPIVVGEPVSPKADVLPKDQLYVIDWKYFYPGAPEISVNAVEEVLKHHLRSQALGTPMQPNKTVAAALNEIKKMQGALIEEGTWEEKMMSAVDRIEKLCLEGEETKTVVEVDSTMTGIRTENTRLRTKNGILEEKLASKEVEYAVRIGVLEAELAKARSEK